MQISRNIVNGLKRNN